MIFCTKNRHNRINNLSLNGGALRVGEGNPFPQHPSTFSLLSLFLSNTKRIQVMFAFLNLPSPTLNASMVRDNVLNTKAESAKNGCPQRTLGGCPVKNRVVGIMKVVNFSQKTVADCHRPKIALRRGKNGLH